MRLCPNCGRPINDNFKFCTYCGFQVKKQCPNCKQYDDQNAKFCIHCGYSFLQHGSLSNSTQMNNSYNSNSQSIKSLKSKVNSYSLSNSISASASLSNSAKSTSASFVHSIASYEFSMANSLYEASVSTHYKSVSSKNDKSSVAPTQISSDDDRVAFRNDKNESYAQLKHKIGTSISYIINHLQNYNMQKITWKYAGGSTVLKKDNHRLVQAYATYYRYRNSMPKLYRIINAYSLSLWKLQYRLDLINQMLSRLSVSKRQLKMPNWAKSYSNTYSEYVKQVKGDEGENWACHNLKRYNCTDFDHNINIPFKYSDYYYRLYYHNLNQSRKYYYHHDRRHGGFYYYRYKKFKKDYKQSKNNPSYKNSNQIDILYVNKYGIFIFEVKNYNRNQIWIDKHGRITWDNPRGYVKKFGHQSGLPIGRQVILHKAAVLSILEKNRSLFSNLDWDKIKHNIYGILVYVKSPKGSHDKIGVYKYDKSIRDYSDKFHITPVDQNHCYEAIKSNSKQLTFTPKVVSRLRNSIFAVYEKQFDLPIFYRENIDSFNNVLRYKHEIGYIYRLLRHQCYVEGILKDVLGNEVSYSIFLTRRDQKRHALHNLYRKANYWYFDNKRNKWRQATNKYDHRVQHYHRKYTKLYRNEKKLYKEFYK